MESGRLSRVTLELADGRLIEMSWEDRDLLLGQLRTSAARSIVASFEAVGATRPVELTELQRLALLGAISIWCDAAEAGRPVPPLPAKVLELRQRLVTELGRA